MPSDVTRQSATVLTLPWNRFPNYLVCVVALVNVVCGIVALKIAYGFATQDPRTLDGVVAAVFIGLFGLMSLWVGWCFRRGVLPVKFVADAEKKECGFWWAGFWNGRFDLANAEQLIGELRTYKKKWHWAILLPSTPAGSSKETWIYGSDRAGYEEKTTAERECQSVLDSLSEHLSLPSVIRDESATE